MLHRLRQQGLSARVLEAGGGVGGTWYWNRYPGARCDIESMEYSYQFSEELQQEWMWTERYASQPEILRYIEHVADRFDLKKDIQFNTRVTSMAFDESKSFWQIESDQADLIRARFCIMAMGCLTALNIPKIKGSESFEGQIIHTARWPEAKVQFGGKRVGIIGTGSSSIQATPLVAKEAKHLFVFQRTPTYTIPAQNAPLDPVKQNSIKADYKSFRERNSQTLFGLSIVRNPQSALEVSIEERKAQYETKWLAGGFNFGGAFGDTLLNPESNKAAVDFICEKIRSIVRNPEIADKLCPSHTFGCKRLCVDSGYYETFNRDNVTLVDLKGSEISEMTKNSILVKDQAYDLDILIFATGFDAMTGALLKIDIRGRKGLELRSKWAEGPKNYLGISVHGFPNLFMIAGPGSPSVLSNLVPSIEQHVNWISDCLAYLKKSQLTCIEGDQKAESEWVSHVNDVANQTLYHKCNSWYLGANIPGKSRIFMPYIGVPAYKKKCDDVAAKNYEGFTIT